MEKAAAIFGTFCGKVLAVVLKEAGPELRAFLVGLLADAIDKVLDDRAVLGKPTADWQRMFQTGNRGATGNGNASEKAGDGGSLHP